MVDYIMYTMLYLQSQLYDHCLVHNIQVAAIWLITYISACHFHIIYFNELLKTIKYSSEIAARASEQDI